MCLNSSWFIYPLIDNKIKTNLSLSVLDLELPDPDSIDDCDPLKEDPAVVSFKLELHLHNFSFHTDKRLFDRDMQ